jgi:hypothetical protein
MKTTLLRFSPIIAALLLSLGFTRAAGSFDTICYGQESSPQVMEGGMNCTSSCPCPDLN